ncbi:MAG: fumarylacetoacetate hydrolase family protein [Haloferacaceae archaeon]
MDLLRFRAGGQARFGARVDGALRDLSGEYESFRALLRAATTDEVSVGDAPEVEPETYLPPTTPLNTVFAAALNYDAHIEEAKKARPERPYMFLKPYRALTGHEEPIQYHSQTTADLDYEAELAVVVGDRLWQAEPTAVDEAIAGYTILNDTTGRDVQDIAVGDAGHIDWFSAKALQGSSPLGPHVRTADEVGDPSTLRIESRLNGAVMQDEGTDMMLFDVHELLSYVSSRVVLEPGDVVATGTPEGVGGFQDIRLTDGDRVEMDVEGVGTLANTVEETG